MRLLGPLAIVLGLALAPGCLATFSAYDGLVDRDGEPRSATRVVTFCALLPALIAVDVVTAPFQYVYVVTHAR